jgi:hypothetical protein
MKDYILTITTDQHSDEPSEIFIWEADSAAEAKKKLKDLNLSFLYKAKNHIFEATIDQKVSNQDTMYKITQTCIGGSGLPWQPQTNARPRDMANAKRIDECQKILAKYKNDPNRS